MKKQILLYLLSVICIFAKAQFVNISTGVDNAGLPLAIGLNDPNWQLVSSPYPFQQAVASNAHPIWNSAFTTPVAGTNAQWVNQNNSFCCYTAGIYRYERDLVIAPGTSVINLNFQVSYDDQLDSLSVVDPSGFVTYLTNTPGSPAYNLGTFHNFSVSGPMPGTWKIKAQVNYIDAIGGFILSGSAQISGCVSPAIATTSGRGCGTVACPWVGTGTPAGGVFSGPGGLTPAGVYIGPIPAAGLPYTYTVVVAGCTYIGTGLITKPTSATPPLPPVTSPYVGPTAAGAQVVITWPCTGWTCGEWYEFRVYGQNTAGTVSLLCTSTSAGPSSIFPFPYTPLPAGTCGKIISCPGMVIGQSYCVQMRVNRCGIFGPWSTCLSTTAAKQSQESTTSAGVSDNNISIYPNPANDILNVDYTSIEETTLNINITDMTGKIVKQIHRQTNKGPNQISIETSHFAAGIYSISITENGKLSHIEKISIWR